MLKFFNLDYLCLFALVLGYSSLAGLAYAGEHTLNSMQQNQHIVSGTVKDAKDEPLIGVSISLKENPSAGVTTSIDGTYSISATGDATLVFSYVGYKVKEEVVGTRTLINVVLDEENKILDEVVVVGYGVQKKVNLTGALSVIESKEMEARPVTNVSSALSGLASGVSVLQTSGRPGSDGATIRIRGIGTLNNSSALVIVDGIESSLDDINPNDIESITILKDAASSAIYGARAANGVILITTKRGTTGKPKITFSGLYSSTSPSRMPKFVTYNPEYMRLMNEANTNVGQPAKYSENLINSWIEASGNPNAVNEFGIPNYVVYANTDWGESVFENNWAQNYNLSATGGSDYVKYTLSTGYMNNPGIMENTGNERYQLRVNLESKAGKYLTLGTNTFMSLNNNKVTNTDNSVFNLLRQKIPGLYPYKYDGYWATPSSFSGERSITSLLRGFESSAGLDKTSRINTTLFARLDIVKGLHFETKFNYQTWIHERNIYPRTSSVKDFSTNTIVETPTVPDEMTTSYTNERSYMETFDNVLNYNFSVLDDHSFGIMLGHNEYYYNTRSNNYSKKGLLDEGIYVPGSASGANDYVTGTESERSMRSFFGRINYDYQSKYLFEFVLRRDGSSRFYKDNRWGYFPSFSAGWRISEEHFMKFAKSWMDNLKLRGSWGKLGNDVASGNWDYMALYGKVNYSFGGNPISGLYQNKMDNEALTWEKSNVLNLGFDGIFLQNRLSFDFEYYNKLAKNILYQGSLYMVNGNISPPTVNLASVRNKGIELSLGWSDKIGNVSYKIKGNFAYNKNEVSKFYGTYETNPDGTNNIGAVGRPDPWNPTYIVEGKIMNEYYLRNIYSGNGSYFNTDGSVNINGGPKDGMIRTEKDMEWVKAMQKAGYKFFPKNNIGKSDLYYGDYLFADTNNDGIYGDDNDRSFTGKSALPKIIYGFGAEIVWKNIDFSMLWAGNGGMYYYKLDVGYNSTKLENGNAIGKDVATNRYFYDPENPDSPNTNMSGTYPRLKTSDDINGISSTRWLYNASFLKLRNLQVGYTIPSGLSKKIGIEKTRVFFSGENLLTITPYAFMDPEIGVSMGYPTMRQIAFGLTVNF